MKIKCKVCRKETEINELDYNPGEKVIVECQRCGNELEAIIPERVEETVDSPVEKKQKNESIKETTSDTASSEQNSQHELNATSNTQSQTVAPPKTAATHKRVPPIPRTPKVGNAGQYNQVNLNNVDSWSDNTPASSNRKWAYIVLGLGVIIGIVFWISNDDSDNNASNSNGSTVESTYVEEVPVEKETVEEVVINQEPTDIAEETNENVEPISEDLPKVYLPIAENHNSSEAYDIYPSYLTDEKMGDDWRSTDLIQNAIKNNSVAFYADGEGDIDGSSVNLQIACLNDGRLYGRYAHSNGIKLDVNGAFDSKNNLVIKLGHQSETSYWVFHYKGTTEDNILVYEGSWGKRNKPSNLRLRIR